MCRRIDGPEKTNELTSIWYGTDQLVKHLESCPAGDFDAYARKLDELGNELDFRRYENELFQLLLIGSLIAPGGGLVQDSANPCPISLLGSVSTKENGQVDIAAVKSLVDIFHKLLRRYKYLQKDFEESTLPNILQNCNKYDGQVPEATTAGGGTTGTPVNKSIAVSEEGAGSDVASATPSRTGTPGPGAPNPLTGTSRPQQEKLAIATALFVCGGLCSPAIVQAVKRDQLVKTGSAAAFLTVYSQTVIKEENLDVCVPRRCLSCRIHSNVHPHSTFQTPCVEVALVTWPTISPRAATTFRTSSLTSNQPSWTEWPTCIPSSAALRSLATRLLASRTWWPSRRATRRCVVDHNADMRSNP